MNTDQKYKLLSMMGYKGPKNESLMSSFIESNPAAGAKMGQFMSASKGFNKGGTVGYASGGYVMGSNNTILKPDGSTYKTYGSLSEAYSDLQKLNNPTTSTPQNGFNTVPEGQPNTSSGGNVSTGTGSGYYTSPTQNNTTSGGLSQSQLNDIFRSTINRDIRSFEVANYANMTPDQVRQALSQRYGTPTQTNQPTTTSTQTSGTNYQNQVQQLYQQILGRQAGQAGLDFYTNLLSSGQITPQQIQQDLTKNKATEDYIKQTYTSVMGRDADLAGIQYYAPLLNSGQLSREEFERQIRNAATGVPAAAGGTQTSGPNVTQNQPPVEQGATSNITNQTEAEQFQQLRNAYRDIFGRNPDQAGMDYYMQQLASGRSQEDILNELIRSEEAQLISNGRYAEAQALRNAQQAFLTAAYQSPQDLVTGQEVASMQVREGELIDPNTGQVSTTAPGYEATTIDPTTGQAQAPEDIGTATYDAQQISDQLQNTLGDLEAQTATPSKEATVKGQLEILMEDFEDGTPPWASGAMRQAMAVMQQRGLGASSMAGQAVVQAAMESATAIAQQDANTYATFELRNLDNRQQTAIFKAQQRISGLFTDQAAANAARQFNASSENQTNQFMASLQESVSRFNAAQVAAIAEYNANAENSAKQFNSTLTDLRERFNAQNGLVIAQANAQWRQNINTINTAAQNDANREYAKQVNTITAASLDQLWQRERDLMTFAYSASESGLDRQLQLLLAERQEDLVKWQQDREEDAARGYVFTRLASDVLFGGGDGGGLLGGLLG